MHRLLNDDQLDDWSGSLVEYVRYLLVPIWYNEESGIHVDLDHRVDLTRDDWCGWLNAVVIIAFVR